MLQALAAVLSLHAGGTPPKVADIPLADLALYADAILIGKVNRVLRLSSADVQSQAPDRLRRTPQTQQWAVAEVDVEQVIRGDARKTKVWFLAQGTWTCDVSKAIPGERALLFLTQTDPLKDAGEKVHELVQELTGGQPVLQDAWAGRGRLPIRVERGVEYVTEWEDVIPPDDLTRGPALHEAYPNIYWMARLDDVVARVDSALKSRAMILPAHPLSGLPATAAIVVNESDVVAAIWKDGSAIWSGDPVAGGAPYFRGQVDGLQEMVAWLKDHPLGVEVWETDAAQPAHVQVSTRLAFESHLLDGATSGAQELRARILGCVPRVGEPAGIEALAMR
ncbi:MAG: hypothetical protein EXS08_14090 [Planctomycetes bacterium]|nr:hypothetical protein [Planctomycetota bacterium]